METKLEKKPDKYRHELKYSIDKRQLETLKLRIPAVIPLDPHVGEKGFYEIRSLYFDDVDNRCYYENKNGTDPREKFRIRIYNGSTERIRLELKRKERGKTLKTSCPLTIEQCANLMDGRGISWEEAKDNPLLAKFFLWQELKDLKPKVIVEYDRIPFICPEGNVRITLDINIRSSGRVEDFMGEKILTRPIMPVGGHLLEVKYDEFLPDYIYRSIQMRGLSQTTFSKYYLCRKFGASHRYSREFSV